MTPLSFRSLATSTAVICTLSVAPAAFAQATYSFDLPAQGLAESLRTVVRRTGSNIVFEPSTVSGKKGLALKGSFTTQQALDRLLIGSNLSAKTANGRSWVIARAKGIARAQPSSIVEDGQVSEAGVQYAAEPSANDADVVDAAPTDDETIVVTAQRRAERILDVPASISVIGGEQLERLGATQLSDYAAYIPGLSVTSGGAPGMNTVRLRGISSGDAASSTVGIYVDDVPIGSSGSYAQAGRLALDLMPYDIAQVEVLRGPQGTLYGASTLGGLLRYITIDPDLYDTEIRMGGELSGTSGASDANWGLRAGVNIPIIEGELAIKGSYFQQNSAGFVDNIATGARNVNDVQQRGGRVAVLWKPADNVSIGLSAIHQKTKADGLAQILLGPDSRPLFGDLTQSFRAPVSFQTKLELYTGTLNWDLGFANFISATSYQETATTEFGDQTSFLDPFLSGIIGPRIYPAVINLALEKFTQEFRLVSPTGRSLEWMIGAFYTDEESSNAQIIHIQNLDGTSAVGLDPAASVIAPSSYREYAAFGNATYRFTDKWDISAGLRWSRNTQTFEQVNIGGSIINLPTVPPQTASDEVLTYLLSSRFYFNRNTMAYARVANGYRPGGPNVALGTIAVPSTYGPDKLTNYEVGFKSELFDRRLAFDLSLFYIDWTDIQLITTGGLGTTALVNGGKASSHGVEFSTSILATAGLRLGLNGAYTDAKLEEDLPPFPGVIGSEGDQLPSTPRWSGSATVNYDATIGTDLNIHFGGGVRYTGERLENFVAPGAPRVRLDSYTAVDLNAGATSGPITATIFVRNLFDTRGYSTAVVQPGGTADAQVTTPRTIGIRVDTRF